MARIRSLFVCQNCGSQAPKWVGRCPECGKWDTMVEETREPSRGEPRPSLSSVGPQPITEIETAQEPRVHSGIEEFDRILGGGAVVGSAVLIGGDPGIGKSTLLLQVAERIAQQGKKALYVSGEESVRQTKLRAQRLGVGSDRLLLVAETDLDLILKHIQACSPDVVVVDSIQMIYKLDLHSAPGSVSQVRECGAELVYLAKRTGIPVFLIGHVTKEGSIAGPRVLEHMVDAVLYFEGDRFHTFRVLRSVKNRFGSTNEIGVFEMRDSGMAEVTNFGGMFIAEREEGAAGSAVFCGMEGTRPLLIEIQALVSHTAFNIPRRMASGADFNRVALIVAVLEKKTGLKLYDQDIYINVAGGLRLSEPAADLAIAAAIVSAFRNKALQGCAVFGEMGLTGEIRSVGLAERRLSECMRMGFGRAVIPKACMTGLNIPKGMQVFEVKNIWEALEKVL